MRTLSNKYLQVLDYIQQFFPLTERPFAKLSQDLDLPEKEIKEIIKELKGEKIIRNIAGIFEAKKLGYYLSLVALEVPVNMISRAASIINSHPGVSHNYLRDHRYNIWFTLAEENQKKFMGTIKFLMSEVKGRDYLVLPSKKMFKIGVFLPFKKKTGKKVVNQKVKPALYSKRFYKTKATKEAVYLLQQDLSLVDRPFASLVKKNKSFLTESQLINFGLKFQENKIMRRYSAVLKHQKAGYNYNAMTAWRVSSEKISPKQLEPFLQEEMITHLYLRPVFPNRWEYPLFAMIHATSKEELDLIIQKISLEAKIKDFLILSTLKEFKKEKVIYFSDKFDKWVDGS